MNAATMNIGGYVNVTCESELADIFGSVVRLMSNFQSDIFRDYGEMVTVMGLGDETRRIWSIRKTGTWYMDVKDYNDVIVPSKTDEPIIQYLVESNSYGEMAFTRLR